METAGRKDYPRHRRSGQLEDERPRTEEDRQGTPPLKQMGLAKTVRKESEAG